MIVDEVRVVHRALCSVIIVDSSSLSKPKDPKSSMSRGIDPSSKIVPCPGAGYGRAEAILWSVNVGQLLVLQLDPYPSRAVGAWGSIIALLMVISTGSRSTTTTTKPVQNHPNTIKTTTKPPKHIRNHTRISHEVSNGISNGIKSKSEYQKYIFRTHLCKSYSSKIPVAFGHGRSLVYIYIYIERER